MPVRYASQKEMRRPRKNANVEKRRDDLVDLYGSNVEGQLHEVLIVMRMAKIRG